MGMKRRRKQDNGAKAQFQRMKLGIMFMYVALIFLVTIVLTMGIMGISDSIISDKVSSLIAANSRQLELNINNYLTNVETAATLLFSNEQFYKFNDADPDIGDYERIKIEEAILDRIADLGLMQNFADFDIIYSNGKRVGWTSSTTESLYDSVTLYENFAANIKYNRKEDGWIFGFGGINDRIYYVKRMNENAIIVNSFYSRELANVFVFPEQLEGMVISLVDDNNKILYSSDADLITQKLDGEVVAVLNHEISQKEAKIFANSNTCGNGWRVVCSIPKDTVMKDMSRLREISIILSAVVAIFTCAVGFLMMKKLIDPMNSAVTNLHERAITDRLTGLLNKLSFEDVTTKALAEADERMTHAFVMIDMDNFKKINDTLGHAYGDDVIRRMGQLLAKRFGNEYKVGRLGGDEYAMCGSFLHETKEGLTRRVTSDIDELFEAFNKEFAKENETIKLSLSVGIHVVTGNTSFGKLYTSADSALYISKNNGKGRYTVYEGE